MSYYKELVVSKDISSLTWTESSKYTGVYSVDISDLSGCGLDHILVGSIELNKFTYTREQELIGRLSDYDYFIKDGKLNIKFPSDPSTMEGSIRFPISGSIEIEFSSLGALSINTLVARFITNNSTSLVNKDGVLIGEFKSKAPYDRKWTVSQTDGKVTFTTNGIGELYSIEGISADGGALGPSDGTAAELRRLDELTKPATNIKLGTIKVGKGLDIEQDGTLNVLIPGNIVFKGGCKLVEESGVTYIKDEENNYIEDYERGFKYIITSGEYIDPSDNSKYTVNDYLIVKEDHTAALGSLKATQAIFINSQETDVAKLDKDNVFTGGVNKFKGNVEIKKSAVDSSDGNLLVESGVTIGGVTTLNGGATVPTGKDITIIDAPTQDTDAANKKYVDDSIDSLDVTSTAIATVNNNTITINGISETNGKIAIDTVNNKVTLADVAKTGSGSDVTYTIGNNGESVNAALTRLDGDDSTTGSVSKKIKDAIDGLDSSVSATAADGNQYSVLTGVTEADGKLTAKTEVKLAAVAKTGTAADVAIVDSGSKITADNVEDALQEIAGKSNTAVQTVTGETALTGGTDDYVSVSASKNGTEVTLDSKVKVQSVSNSSSNAKGLAEASDVKNYVDTTIDNLAGTATSSALSAGTKTATDSDSIVKAVATVTITTADGEVSTVTTTGVDVDKAGSAAKAKEEVIGNNNDTKDSNTIYGTKKYADYLMAALGTAISNISNLPNKDECTDSDIYDCLSSIKNVLNALNGNNPSYVFMDQNQVIGSSY